MSFSGKDSDADRMLVSRVEDTVSAAQRHYDARFLGFLDLHERAIALSAAERLGSDCEYVLWGGYENAERVMFGVYPPGSEKTVSQFPLACVHITWKFGTLTHRDFLGALLSLGIKREKIGDILAGKGECDAVLDASVARFVAQSLEKVGGSGVSCEMTDGCAIKKEESFQEIRDTIASERLDCVAAALLNISRSETVKLIENGSISVDFVTSDNVTQKIMEGSTVSIRGHGRFIIDGIGPPTKKSRLRFAARKYL